MVFTLPDDGKSISLSVVSLKMQDSSSWCDKLITLSKLNKQANIFQL